MIVQRAALVSGLLVSLAGCVDYGPQGYVSTPVANAPPFVSAGGGYASSITSVDQFYAPLAPFGRWVQTANWGNAWQPAVGPGWQPYTIGRWLDDPQYGRTWMGDEPWSWATDHYGRWGYDTQLGWLWVPGTQWAPAWVAWRDGSDTMGWAPLPPLVGFGVGVGAMMFDSWGYDQWYAPSWVYVPRGAVYAPYSNRPRVNHGRDQWNATRPAQPGGHGDQHGYGQNGGQYGGQHGDQNWGQNGDQNNGGQNNGQHGTPRYGTQPGYGSQPNNDGQPGYGSNPRHGGYPVDRALPPPGHGGQPVTGGRPGTSNYGQDSGQTPRPPRDYGQPAPGNPTRNPGAGQGGGQSGGQGGYRGGSGQQHGSSAAPVVVPPPAPAMAPPNVPAPQPRSAPPPPPKASPQRGPGHELSEKQPE